MAVHTPTLIPRSVGVSVFYHDALVIVTNMHLAATACALAIIPWCFVRHYIIKIVYDSRFIGGIVSYSLAYFINLFSPRLPGLSIICYVFQRIACIFVLSN